MKPSAKQLIDSVVWSIDERVAPLTEDKWAASTLRSVRCLLVHLATRVETEGQLLFDDNADLDTVGRELASALSGVTGALADRRDALAELGSRTWREPVAYPTVASMTEENDARREALDRLLRALRTAGDSIDTGTRQKVTELADAYLRRRIERDRPMFAPAFMSSTF